MIFSLENILFRYSSKAPFSLGPLSLSFDSTKVTAVIGSNGSGKTTLIRILLRQITATDGFYKLDNNEITDLTGDFCNNHGIGYAPEYPLLDEALTGYEIMQIIRELRGIGEPEFLQDMTLFTKYLGLGDWLQNASCKEYSQGMRRKIALMIAWLGATSYIIADEPTNGLDPLAVFGVKKLIQERKQNGVGTIISSHVLDLVEKIADHIIILRAGAAAFSGPLDDLLGRFPGKSLDEIYYHIFTNSDMEQEVLSR